MILFFFSIQDARFLFFCFKTKTLNKLPPSRGSCFSLREEVVLLGTLQPNGPACGKPRFTPTSWWSSSLGIVIKICKQGNNEIICILLM